MSEVINLAAAKAHKTGDADAWSPAEMLEDVARMVGRGASDPTEAVVILLRRSGNDYDVARYVSRLSASEVLALLEVAKRDILDTMKG